jgi:hypothetical protein
MRTLVDGAVLLFLLALAITPQLGQPIGSTPTMRDSEFFAVMRTVSNGWNEGNASKAADCFTDDAVYMEPPDRQVYVGRKAIYVFFGGPKQPESPMQMKWHHLLSTLRSRSDTESTHSKETINITASSQWSSRRERSLDGVSISINRIPLGTILLETTGFKGRCLTGERFQITAAPLDCVGAQRV